MKLARKSDNLALRHSTNICMARELPQKRRFSTWKRNSKPKRWPNARLLPRSKSEWPLPPPTDGQLRARSQRTKKKLRRWRRVTNRSIKRPRQMFNQKRRKNSRGVRIYTATSLNIGRPVRSRRRQKNWSTLTTRRLSRRYRKRNTGRGV